MKGTLSSRNLLFGACLVAAVASLGAGFGLGGQRLLGLVAWLTALPWLLVLLPEWGLPVPKWLSPWLPPACLALSVCLAAIGLLLGAPPLLMILASTAALGCWDLALLDRPVAAGSHSEGARAFEARHARSLALALGVGLLLVGLGRFLSFRLPFGVMALLVLLDLFALNRAWGGVK